MSENKGSRNVSLGPYRSTELALEDRLSEKDIKETINFLAANRYGLVPTHDFSHRQLIDIISALGYVKESDSLYIRHKNESTSNQFVYLPETKDFMMMVSGDYETKDKLLLDLDSVKDAFNYHILYSIQENSEKESAISLGTFIGTGAIFGSGVYIMFSSTAFLAVIGLFGGAVSLFGRKIIRDVLSESKIRNLTSSLSKNILDYSFGSSAYEKIISEYHLLSLESNLKGSHNLPKLETSELKRLPDKENKQ